MMILERLAKTALRMEGGSHLSFRMNLQEKGHGKNHVALRQKSTTVFFTWLMAFKNAQIINGVSSSQLSKGTASLLIMSREHC